MTFTFRCVLCVCALGLLSPAAAYGVCFAPGTTTSGYAIPLESEVHSSSTIVVGDVAKVRELHDDPADPAGVTSFIYTVQVYRWLKGSSPRLISLQVNNDSGGYRMDLQEKHLLFLTRAGGKLAVDSCGNSSLLPQGRATLVTTELLLSRSPQQP